MELSPLYDKETECLNCKKNFPSSKVRSKSIKIESTDTDFCPTYVNNTVHAFYYNVFVCEHCGFAFTEDFSIYFGPGKKEEITSKITSNWFPRSFNGERSTEKALEAFKLALFSGITKKEKAVTLAGLCLRIAWIYRSIQNEEQETRFITLARDQYLESFSNGDYEGTQMSEIRVFYIIAELSRRVNDIDNATRFFSKVIEHQRVGGEGKLIEMAKDQWQILKEKRQQDRELNE